MADRSRTVAQARITHDIARPVSRGIVCRRLWAGDAAAVRACFLRLDPAARSDRFMAAVSDRVAAVYGERAPTADGAAYGAFVGGTLRGLGELRPMKGPTKGPIGGSMGGSLGGPPFGLGLGREAEAAFTVERGYRRAGIGSVLFRRVLQAARNRGVAEVHMRCLTDNGAMRRLAVKLGAQMQVHGSETEGTIRLEQATWLSLWSEGLTEAIDLMGAVAAPPARDPARPA